MCVGVGPLLPMRFTKPKCHHLQLKKSIRGTLYLNAAHFPAAVFCQCIGVYSISTAQSHYFCTSKSFWHALYSIPQTQFCLTHHSNISSHYLIDLLAFVTKSCSRSQQSTSDGFPISDQKKVESASIGADIGGVLQGKPAVTGLMCSCHFVLT